jgi:hypothetical protein
VVAVVLRQVLLYCGVSNTYLVSRFVLTRVEIVSQGDLSRMKSFKLGMMVLALGSTGSMLIADDSKAKCPGVCATEGSSCCLSAGMEKLPKIAYLVGEKSLCCEESAKATAASTKAKLIYVVGNEKFDSSDKAFVSLVDQTEKFVAAFATPSTCKVSGTTTIGGECVTCSVKAGEIATKVKKAMDSVAISYKVGDKSCSCPVEAKTLAADKKMKTLFVVDKEETECEQTARLNLARAKYKAALIAMAPEKTEAKVQ